MDVVKLCLKVLDVYNEAVSGCDMMLSVLSDRMQVFLIFLDVSIGNKAFKHVLRRYKVIQRIFTAHYIGVGIVRRSGNCGSRLHKLSLKKMTSRKASLNNKVKNSQKFRLQFFTKKRVH